MVIGIHSMELKEETRYQEAYVAEVNPFNGIESGLKHFSPRPRRGRIHSMELKGRGSMRPSHSTWTHESIQWN